MVVAEFLQLNLLEFMYMSSCVIGTAAYMPQALRLLKDKTDSASVAISSWLIWVYTTCVGFGYAAFVNGDPLMMLSMGLSAFCCLTITALLIFNRYGKKRYYGRTDISMTDIVFKKRHLQEDFILIDPVLKAKAAILPTAAVIDHTADTPDSYTIV